jgi:uncharacterized protein YgiM (DUF1202 family)
MDEKVKKEEQTVYSQGNVDLGCFLRLRKEPSIESEILTVLNPGEEIKVDLTHSTNDFYKVFVHEFKGYCLKQFIKLKE